MTLKELTEKAIKALEELQTKQGLDPSGEDEGAWQIRVETENLFRSSLTDIAKKTLEAVMVEEKEQLDKNDPDNYGACYAIGGWNHCRQQIKDKQEEYLKRK